MQDLQRIYSEIERYRIKLSLPDSMSDEKVLELVKLTKDMAYDFVKNMKNKFEEIIPKVHKKLRKMGYSQEELDEYEILRFKVRNGMKYRVDTKIRNLSVDYLLVHTQLLKKSKLTRNNSTTKLY